MNAPTIQLMNTSQIMPGDNDRREFKQRDLQTLADSIRDNGLAQPITVRPVWKCEVCGRKYDENTLTCGDCGGEEFTSYHEIVAGERRFRACSHILGWDTIPAIARHLSDEEADAIMLTENVHRVDLNPIDEGYAYQKRIERHSWSIAEVARRANVSEGRVRNRLSFLKLRPDVQKLVADGHLSLGFGEEMSVLDANRQLIALRWLQEQRGTPHRRAFAAVVGQLYQEQCQESLFDVDPFWVQEVDHVIEEKGSRMKDILPRIEGLPPVNRGADSMGKLLDEYITALLDDERDSEARVLADFWAKAMDGNWCRLSPYNSDLLKRHPAFALGA